DTTVAGSYIQSGGDTTIIARGTEGESGTGDIAVIGSEIHAGGKVVLDAANDILLASAEEISDFSSSNSSKSSGIGATIGIGLGKGGGGLNVGVNANASTSKGSGQGSDVRHVETIIHGDEGVDFTSGNDTTLKGAQVIGEQVTGHVGGDLAIISEQDTFTETRKQDSKGGSISIGSGLGSLGGSYNQQNQKAPADYASVDEQSGIYAGDGEFDITVEGNTHLEGAVIASTADPADNHLTTGTLTTADIDNSMEYEGSTKGFGGEFSYAKGASPDDKHANKGSLAPGLPLKEKGDDHSTTKSAIAEGTITITDEETQLAAIGQTADETITTLNRDTDNAHKGPLERPPSLEELLAEQAELAEAAAAAGRAVAETVGDISQTMYRLSNEDPKWAEGGAYKILLQGIGSAIIGELGNGDGFNAALGAMASQLAAKNINQLATTIASHLGKDPESQKVIANFFSNLLSDVIGAAAGGESGASLASIMNRYNQQLHAEQMTWINERNPLLLAELKRLYPDMDWSADAVQSLLTVVSLSLLDAGWAGAYGLPTEYGVLGSPDFYTNTGYPDWFKSVVKYASEARNADGSAVFWSTPDQFYDSSIGVDKLTYNLKLDALGIDGKYAYGEYYYFYLKYASSMIIDKDPNIPSFTVPRGSEDTKYLLDWYNYVDGALYEDSIIREFQERNINLYDRFGNPAGGIEVSYAAESLFNPADFIGGWAAKGVNLVGKGLIKAGGRLIVGNGSLATGSGLIVGNRPLATGNGLISGNVYKVAESIGDEALHSSLSYARLKSELATIEVAEDVIYSLRTTGKLPPNYVTKEVAKASGWSAGKAVGNSIPEAQIGGDVFMNRDKLLPSAAGRTWYEADVGLSNIVSRAKQPGTRLLYSNDGLLYITTDHYKTFTSIGRYK
ncbi:MAG: hemagglutinin repeat-containing protein, partial [Clostridium sp.]|nr:hemagglutinin repeat-containing protein [Clostridium sp.]